jgi:hypothetical protein
MKKMDIQMKRILEMVASHQLPPSSLPTLVNIMESSMSNTFFSPIIVGIKNSTTNLFSNATPQLVYTKFQKNSEIYTLQKKNEIISEFLEKNNLLETLGGLAKENRELRRLQIFSIIVLAAIAGITWSIAINDPLASIDPKKNTYFFYTIQTSNVFVKFRSKKLSNFEACDIKF